MATSGQVQLSEEVANDKAKVLEAAVSKVWIFLENNQDVVEADFF